METTRERVVRPTTLIFRCTSRPCGCTRRVEATHAFTRVQSYYVRIYDHTWTVATGERLYGNAEHVNGLRCTCGAAMVGRQLVAKVTEHKCGSKCTSARGHVCECECGGKNHGCDHG